VKYVGIIYDVPTFVIRRVLTDVAEGSKSNLRLARGESVRWMPTPAYQMLGSMTAVAEALGLYE